MLENSTTDTTLRGSGSFKTHEQAHDTLDGIWKASIIDSRAPGSGDQLKGFLGQSHRDVLRIISGFGHHLTQTLIIGIQQGR